MRTKLEVHGGREDKAGGLLGRAKDKWRAAEPVKGQMEGERFTWDKLEVASHD